VNSDAFGSKGAELTASSEEIALFDRVLTKHSGPLVAMLAAALFGASTPVAKMLLGHGIDPWLLAGLLYSGSGVGFSMVFLLRRRNANEPRLQRADLGWLALVVLTGGVAAPLLLMVGLSHTSASSASLLLNLEGLATMTIAWVVFKEYVDRRLLLGALAILAGALVLSFRGAGGFGIGSLPIVAACLGWGIDNNLTRKISGGNPVQIAAVKGIVAGALNLSLAFAHGAIWPTTAQIIAAATLGFFGVWRQPRALRARTAHTRRCSYRRLLLHGAIYWRRTCGRTIGRSVQHDARACRCADGYWGLHPYY
jgi:drug/metabolite transporter (DMT)-like permease